MLSVLRILDGKHLLDIAKDNYGWTEKNIPEGFGTIDFMLDYRQKIEPKMVINKQKEKNIITSELLKNVEEILFFSQIAHISEGWAETFPPRKDLMDEKSFHDWKELNWKYLWDRWLVIKKIGIVEIDLYDPLSNTNISVSHLCIGQVDGIWIKVKEKE